MRVARLVMQASLTNIMGLLEQKKYRLALAEIRLILLDNEEHNADVMSLLYRHWRTALDDDAYPYFMVECMMLCREYDDALELLRELFEETPLDARIYEGLAKLYKKNVKRCEIRDIFEFAFQQEILEPPILDLLPSAYLEDGDLRKSIHFFESLLILKPEVSYFRKTLAQLYEEAGEFALAISMYEHMVTQSPSLISEVAINCERICEKDGRNINARKALVEFYSKSCNPTLAVEHLMIVVNQDGTHMTWAMDICKQLLLSYPDTIEVLDKLAILTSKLGHFSETIECLRRIFTQHPEHPQLLEQVTAVLVQYPSQLMALQLRLDLHMNSHNYEAVLQDVSDILESLSPSDLNEMEPNYFERCLDQALTHGHTCRLQNRYLLSLYFYKSNKLIRAENELKRLLHTDIDLEANVLLSRLYLKMDKPQEAKKRAFELLARNGLFQDVHILLRDIHVYASQEQAPTRHADDAIKGLSAPANNSRKYLSAVFMPNSGAALMDDTWGAHKTLLPVLMDTQETASSDQMSFLSSKLEIGTTAFFLQDFKKASDAFTQALALDPTSLEAKLNLAVLKIVELHIDDALTELHLLNSEYPNSEAVLLNLGVAHYLNHDSQSASLLLIQVLKTNYNQLLAHIILGDIAATEGRLEEALNHWDKAFQQPKYFWVLQQRLWHLCPTPGGQDWPKLVDRSVWNYFALGQTLGV